MHKKLIKNPNNLELIEEYKQNRNSKFLTKNVITIKIKLIKLIKMMQINIEILKKNSQQKMSS